MSDMNGIFSYLMYSHISAKLVRRALKKEFLDNAIARERSLINIYKYKDGKKGDLVVPLKIRSQTPEEEFAREKVRKSN